MLYITIILATKKMSKFIKKQLNPKKALIEENEDKKPVKPIENKGQKGRSPPFSEIALNINRLNSSIKGKRWQNE